jgi:hypothetical protein
MLLCAARAAMSWAGTHRAITWSTAPCDFHNVDVLLKERACVVATCGSLLLLVVSVHGSSTKLRVRPEVQLRSHAIGSCPHQFLASHLRSHTLSRGSERVAERQRVGSGGGPRVLRLLLAGIPILRWGFRDHPGRDPPARLASPTSTVRPRAAAPMQLLQPRTGP